MNERIDAECKIGIVAHEFVRYRAGKTVAAAGGIKTQQVVAVTFGFADPQFADQAAAGQRLAHERLLWGWGLGAEIPNPIASQMKSEPGLFAVALITIKLVIFHAKVT